MHGEPLQGFVQLYLESSHVCILSPGRFFAANELKIMMTYVVMNYDVKFEQEGVRPENVHLGLAIMPDPKAKVLFRKRRSGEV